MQKGTLILGELEQLVDIFESAAIDSVSSIFGQEGVIEKPWAVVDQLTCPCEHLISMGTANPDFSALMLVGVSQDSLGNLLGELHFEPEYLFDVLGELINTYCALLDDNERYSEHFGKQIQTVPVLYSDGAPFIPFLKGIQGIVTIGTNELYFGFVIRKNLRAGEGN